MISKELNVGRAGQYLVLADLLIKGEQAFDTSEGVGYDVVVDTGYSLERIQVKTTQKARIMRKGSNPVYFFNLKRAGKNGKRHYKEGDFDAYALVVLDTRKVMYLPFDRTVASNSLCIRDKEIEYKGRAKGGRSNGLYS